ncbi:hypothetical protein RhiJN_06556 [Ceratobasidium sp. AG-Ba]|nr:hypothetical protein RhiJN_06556 [Ceratobasidium sp. AG-Ba]
MIIKTLTEEEMGSIKMMAIRQFGHISMRNYERTRNSFRDKIRLLSLQRPKTHVETLAGFKPELRGAGSKVQHCWPVNPRRNTLSQTPDMLPSRVFAPLDKRDASLTKYEYDEDKNLRNNKEVEMIKVFGYGRLDFILAPAAPNFGVDEPHFLILAHIAEAKDARRDASIKRISYTRLGRLFVLDITSVKHVVGGVKTRGEKEAGEWVIIDGSESLFPNVFHQEQEGFGDDD